MINKIVRFFTNPNARYNLKRKILERTVRKRIVKRMRKTIQNQDFSVISSDCIGGLIYHDLNMQFRSPTVNLFIPAHSFVKFCSNLRYYMAIEPVEVETDEHYPVMRIDDVFLHGVHYKSFDELKEKWEERKQRINYDNLFMIFTAKDGFDESLLPFIDEIPGKKVLFSNKPYDYEWCCVLPQFKRCRYVGDLTRYVGIRGNKYYEAQFNVVKWLNGSYTACCMKKERHIV